MTLRTLPDVERMLSEFLRGDDDVADTIGDRCYSVLPSAPTFPCIRVSRVGGSMRTANVYHLEASIVQVEALGGTRQNAWSIAETARAAIAQRLTGNVVVGDVTAVVTSVDVGGIRSDTVRSLPKDTNGTDRHRAHFDAVIYAHPTPTTGS